MACLVRRCTPALWALVLLCACDESESGTLDASDGVDSGEEDAGAASDAGDTDDAAPDASEDGGANDGGPVELPCEVTPPTACPDPPVYYEDITPILQERCLGCHDGKGEQWPLTSYSHVTGWLNEIRAAMVSCDMPPADAGIHMPAQEREQILTWLLCKVPQRGDAGAGGH